MRDDLYAAPSAELAGGVNGPASAIGETLKMPNIQNMELALKHQKSFWKMVGVISLIFIVLIVAVSALGLVGVMMATAELG